MDTPVPPPEVVVARMRWRAAGESLFPTLIADPSGYSGAVEAIGAVASALRRRAAGLTDLVEAVKDGGFIIDPTDAGALAGAVERLAADRTSRERMGAAGRAWVEENFRAENNTRLLAQAFYRAASAAG